MLESLIGAIFLLREFRFLIHQKFTALTLSVIHHSWQPFKFAILKNNTMKKNLLLTVIILQSFLAGAQRFEWVSHSTQGVVPTYYSPDAVDAAGNIYTLISTGSSGAIIQGENVPR